MKLTALFTARRGRQFLATLSEKEGRNYQFDFLRPTHSLFAYFNRLVEQYTKVLYPNKQLVEQLKERTKKGARWELLEKARKHAKWEKNRREREKRRQDDQEAERSAFHTSSFAYQLLNSFLQLPLPKLTGTTMRLFKPSSSPLRMLTPNYRLR